METLPIWRRLFGSVMDKLIILVLFIIIGCILSPYGFSGDLGTFVGGILKDSPSSFQYTAENGGYPPTQNGEIRSLIQLFRRKELQNETFL